MGNTKSNIATTRIRLIQAKQVLKFFCLFVLVYSLLMVLWPELRATYTKLYIAGANSLFGSFGSNGIARFYPSTKDKSVININLYNKDRRNERGNWVSVRVSDTSHRAGYLFMAFLSSLILATPVSWRRRGWALFWGLILIHGFVYLQLAIRILQTFVNVPQLSLFALSPFWKQVLSAVNQEFAVHVTLGFIVSVLIWILVSFRREDWSKIAMYRGNLGTLYMGK
jgi:hypothetical protein